MKSRVLSFSIVFREPQHELVLLRRPPQKDTIHIPPPTTTDDDLSVGRHLMIMGAEATTTWYDKPEQLRITMLATTT